MFSLIFVISRLLLIWCPLNRDKPVFFLVEHQHGNGSCITFLVFFFVIFSSFLGWFSKKKLYTIKNIYHTIPKTHFFLRTTIYKSCPILTCTVVQIFEIDNIVGHIVIDVKRAFPNLKSHFPLGWSKYFKSAQIMPPK